MQFGATKIFFMECQKNKSNRFVQHAGAFTANLSAFALGNIFGWSAPASSLLIKGSAGYPIDEDENSLVGAVINLGAAISSLPAGYITGRFGRKKTMLGLVGFLLLGWGLIIWAKNVKMLYFGRFILGLCGGIICVTAPVFTVEICEKEIRGALGIYYQLMISGGILFCYIIGSQVDLFWLSVVCALVPIIFGIAFIFFPETPVYYLSIGQPEKAREALRFYRGPHYDLEPEFAELAQYSYHKELDEVSIWESFTSKQGAKSLGMSIGMMAFRQLTGFNPAVCFTTSIFERSGSCVEPKYATIVTGVVMLVSTFLAVLIVDRLGRVALLGYSILLTAISTFILGLYLYLYENHYNVSSFTWVPLVFMCIYFIVFSVGYGSVPWALMPEIIPSRIKSLTTSIACVVNWICAFVVTQCFADLSNAVGVGVTFWIFTSMSVVGTGFSFKFLPETKGKSFEEIQRNLGGKK